jgi:prefoldin subunit 5
MAIQKNVVPLGTAQATYKQEVIAVSMQMTSVLTSNLPTLNQSPPDLQDFISTLSDAKSAASDWVNTVLFRLLGVPGQVRTYQDSVVAYLTNALNETNTLIQNPNDSTAAAGLQADLNNLRCTLTGVRIVIDSTVRAIENFGDKLPRIAMDLDSIATGSAADAQADQQQIDKLNAMIEDLKQAIKRLTAAIVGLAIADGLALTAGLVATIAAFPEGALVWFVTGPVIAVATTFIALDAEEIKADKARIQGLENQIQGITADVATLGILSKNFSDLATGTTTVASSLNTVLQMWQNLETDVVDALAGINAAIADKTSESFGRLRADLAEAMHEWNQLYALAGNLHLDLNVNTAGLQLGMSRSQVQAAAAKGKVVDIIQYYNTLGI